MFRVAITNARPPRCPHVLLRQALFSTSVDAVFQQALPEHDGDSRPSLSQNRKRRRAAARANGEQPTSTNAHLESERPESTKRLLLPFELTKRILRKRQDTSVEAAIELLKNAPKDAQNVKVWNTMIQECLKAGKYQQAYALFIDMKRRGFTPSLRTYATMLMGYSNISDWSKFPKQLDNVGTVYEHLKKLIAESGDDMKEDSYTILFPIAIYIEILGNAGRQDTAFDVFHALPSHGRLAPNGKIYSSIIAAIGKGKPEGNPPVRMSYIWRQYEKANLAQPAHSLDSRAVEALIQVLTKDPSQKELVFHIIYKCLGLAMPGDTPSEAKTPLTHNSITAAIKAAVNFKEYSTGEYYLQQCLHDQDKREFLRHWHIYEVVLSMGKMAKRNSHVVSQKVLALMQEVAALNSPNLSSRGMWISALTVCWTCRDWTTASKISQLMSSSEVPPLASARSVDPNPNEWSRTFREAMATQEPLAIRHCLGLFDAFGSDNLTRAVASPALSASNHIRSLASLVVRAVRSVMPTSSSPDQKDGEAMKRWQRLKAMGEEILYRDRNGKRGEVNTKDLT